MKLKQKSQSGVSLVETLIAIFIIGLILLLYQAAMGKVQLIRYAKNQETALRIANNKIEELRATGYDDLPESGSFSDPQLENLIDGEATMTFTEFNGDTKQVALAVQYRNKGGAALRNVTLTTLITKIGGL